MKLDIFTLFPEAFGWFEGQRSVQNALAQGNELRLFNYRDTTPLTAGQVDDAPYGGGAGMVLRVDVVDAALQAAYPSGESPRRVLLSPTGRLLDDLGTHPDVFYLPPERSSLGTGTDDEVGA